MASEWAPSSRTVHGPGTQGLAGGSDGCATPEAIAGQGSFAYDQTLPSLRLIVDDYDDVAPEVFELIEPVLLATADLAPDDSGQCQQISLTLEVEAVGAWLYEE